MLAYILTDIEGTTTSISFVHEVLFPYATQHLPDYIRQNAENPRVLNALEGVTATLKDEGGIDSPSLETQIETLLNWIQTDRKHTALKDLQGQIWEKGYEDGDYKGHVYPDVSGALQRWKAGGIGLGVYSSGSVAAQKLLYKFSDDGNLAQFFSHHFDTNVGHKKEVQSYLNILEALGLPAGDVMFLSDVAEELDAAQAAGMQTRQTLRPGIPPCDRHEGIEIFDDLEDLVWG